MPPQTHKIHITFNQVKRICTIVSDPNTRERRVLELKSIPNQETLPNIVNKWRYYTRRYYTGIKTLRTINRNTTADSKLFPYNSTYNLRNNKALNITIGDQKFPCTLHLPIFAGDKTMNYILETHTIIKIKMQTKSLNKY